MVFHKRLDYGSSGHQVPTLLRFPSSVRGKRSPRKKVEDKPMCAFDLLATVAGELLSERENALQSPKIDGVKNKKPFKSELFDQGSCNESSLGSLKQVKYTTNECLLSPRAVKSCIGTKTPLMKNEMVDDAMEVDAKPPALISSDSSVEVPIHHKFGNGVPRKVLFPKRENGNDDENSSVCTHPKMDTQCAEEPRIRKLFTSKFRKVVPNTSKDTNYEMKGIYRNRKMSYTRQRTERGPFKRRKLFHRRSISASNLDIYEDSVNSPKLGGNKMEAHEPHASCKAGPLSVLANGASSSTSGQKKAYESGDCHVKLSIKSFKVPELFIDIPENATIGSLKRTITEAVTSILGGGLRVGVFLQGKKVGDDSKTLLQAGISHDDKLENLGFTLEPNATPSPRPLLLKEDPDSMIPADAPEQFQRIPAALEVIPQAPQLSNLNCPESDHDSVHSHMDASSVYKTPDSKALVPVPSMNAEALAVVPLRKSRHTDLVQRRIRRPFSVTEVEALVQAVEKLGTGRWRDVKLRAFDNAKHRTYVDLKDKWKTLVHTARISPQQRRGEPVPQELLDRVLAAHAYWSQQQAKLQAKSTSAEACLLA